MPLTVITVKNAPPSLRGDLSKWMQEIATGVYVGNFNSRIREKLWERVKENIGKGESTLSYYCRNELGYNFDTFNTERCVVDFDGMPLVFLPNSKESTAQKIDYGFSDASRNRKWKKYAAGSHSKNRRPFVVLDIETDGLDENVNKIIEIGALKIAGDKIEEFSCLIRHEGDLSDVITKLTGIRDEEIKENGIDIEEALSNLNEFIGNLPIIGYGVGFDIRFLNYNLKKLGMEELTNRLIDLMSIVKSKNSLKSYKLQSAINAYGIEKTVPHRGLQDAKIIYELSLKLMKFIDLRS